MTRPADISSAPSRRVFAALLLGLVAACAHAGDARLLRYDGLYVTDEISGTPRSYLRFYADGSVAMASVSGPSTPQDVAAWLTPSHAFSAHGTYDIQRDRISVSVTPRTPATSAPASAIFYQGVIRGDEIELDRGGAGEVVIANYRFAAVSFPN